MRRVFAGLFPALFVAALVAPSRAADQFEPVRVNIRHALDVTTVPSVAVAVAKDGNILWEEGFGWADREKRIPATAHTLYSLSSITKTFTATGLMLLVRVGRLDLDKPVNEYLGDAKLSGRAGDASKATVRSVANHSSGLPPHYQYFYEGDPYRPPSMDEMILHYGILVRPPGERYEYSNLGYGILGEVISRVMTEPYRDFMRQEVFAKLGLRETSVNVGPGFEGSAATPYESDDLPLPRYVSDSEGAGAIYSSAHDLARFGLFHLKAHLANQDALLLDRQIDEMQTPSVMVTKNAGYGIGWGIADTPSGYRVVSHTGKASGVATAIRLVPSEKIAIIVLCNSGHGLPHKIADDIMKILLPKFDGRASVPDFRANQDSLAPLYGTWRGKIHTYKADLPFSLRFLESGDVHAQISNQLKTLLNFVSWQGGELKGRMLGDVGTDDAGRRPYTLSLDLKLRGKVLNGSATAESLAAPRNGSALSYWVELSRSSEL